MENQPRLMDGYHVEFSHGHMVWVDTCIQQVLSAKILIQIADIIGRSEDESVSVLRDEVCRLTRVINETLWDEGDAFYYDLWKNGELNKVKSVGAYWALLADIIPPERLDRFVSHLENEREFKRRCRVPTLSADHPDYRSDGGYWRGGVWAPTNYMVMNGLAKNGYEDLAHDIARNCLENVIAIFERDGTLYENYAPEAAAAGNPAKKDFVGWSGLFPVSILFEYVFVTRPLARERKIIWNIRLLERHGVKNYPLDGFSLDLLCKQRSDESDEPVVTAYCDVPVEIELRFNGKTRIIHTRQRE